MQALDTGKCIVGCGHPCDCHVEMANIVMEVSFFFFFFFSCEFSVSISWACIKLKYSSHAIYVHKIHYDTAVCIFHFAMAFKTTTLVSSSVTEKKRYRN